jgi:hypothetical protein
MGVGFVLNFTLAGLPDADLEIESDVTFVRRTVLKHLTVNAAISRPRIVVNEGVSPFDSENNWIVSGSAASNPLHPAGGESRARSVHRGRHPVRHRARGGAFKSSTKRRV